MARIPIQNVISGLHSTQSGKQYEKNSRPPPDSGGCLSIFAIVIIFWVLTQLYDAIGIIWTGLLIAAIIAFYFGHKAKRKKAQKSREMLLLQEKKEEELLRKAEENKKLEEERRLIEERRKFAEEQSKRIAESFREKNRRLIYYDQEQECKRQEVLAAIEKQRMEDNKLEELREVTEMKTCGANCSDCPRQKKDLPCIYDL